MLGECVSKRPMLWLALRDRRLAGFKFVRQTSIEPYIADFVCRERRLVVEVDGGQHFDNPSDRRRDKQLGTEGYRVLRFWNNDVLTNLDGVLTTILTTLEANDI
jgi:very-short-patch-repair endonuclease